MKKLLISLFALTVMSFTYAEEVVYYENGGDYSQQEMDKRWERIKQLDNKLLYDPDKGRLKANHDLYEQEFTVFIEDLKQNPERLFQVGDYYFRDGRYDKAYQIFSQDNTNLKNIFGAATTARFLNDNENALRLYDEAIEKNPNFYESYLGRGIIRRNSGNYDGAIEDFNKYMEYVQNESVYLGLGDTYMASGRYIEAKNILEVGRSKFPNSVLIKEMLTKAYGKLK